MHSIYSHAAPPLFPPYHTYLLSIHHAVVVCRCDPMQYGTIPFLSPFLSAPHRFPPLHIIYIFFSYMPTLYTSYILYLVPIHRVATAGPSSSNLGRSHTTVPMTESSRKFISIRPLPGLGISIANARKFFFLFLRAAPMLYHLPWYNRYLSPLDVYTQTDYVLTTRKTASSDASYIPLPPCFLLDR
ncbi:uncharacterized protein F4812DRAFT_427767 [Daldinia caldariorum]|uniref:uncharacterized protein n=1 Tax=Daldinia caldariorum TaxID=326644 RepID=UPI002008B48E|nr:uncharacterized protein F4812DRAFT_427767 [Daldinia caldariorum]KAI1467842.1 hypothetical protein F4812DRAFT_427767 [Daldinia caldariorum]